MRVLLLVLATTLLTGTAPPIERRVDGQVFHSPALPKISIRVSEGIEYAGVSRFRLGEKAAVERYHFVDARDGRIRRMVILQLEGFLEGAEGRYNYRIPKTLASGSHRFSPEKISLGANQYIHNTWAFNWSDSVRNNPGAEADQTRRFLESSGWEVPDEWIMSRFVRAVGDARRHEIIIFYMEPLTGWDAQLSDFPESAGSSAKYDRISSQLTSKSLEAFQVIAG